MNWQPMADAPTDGSVVIVKGKYRPTDTSITMQAIAAQFRDGQWWRDNYGGGFTVPCSPTGFVPMPGGDS